MVTADVLIYSGIGVGMVTLKFKQATIDVSKDAKYFTVGMAKLTGKQGKHSLPPAPHIIDEALKYTKTKFFRLILDLMKLAQFAPEDCVYAFGAERFHEINSQGFTPIDFDIDFSVSVAEIDAQLYRKYEFTQAMIDFVEAKYSYDE